jgi:hypothetical protein
MNYCRETAKMAVPPGNRRLLGPRRTLRVRRREVTLEDAGLPARRAYSSERRTAISVVAASDS